MNEQLQRDLQGLNERWLLAAREGFQQDPDQAALAFGLPVSVGKQLARLPQEDIVSIASSELSLIRPRQSPQWWQAMCDALERQDQHAVDMLHTQTIAQLPVETGWRQGRE